MEKEAEMAEEEKEAEMVEAGQEEEDMAVVEMVVAEMAEVEMEAEEEEEETDYTIQTQTPIYCSHSKDRSISLLE